MSSFPAIPDQNTGSTEAAETSKSKHRTIVFLLLVSVFSMGLAAFAAYHVAPYMDEGTFSDASWNLSHHGFMGTTVLETTGTGLTRLERHTYWVMPLYLVGQAGWMLVVHPSLFGVRLFSVFWIPFSIFALYIFLRRIGCGETAALFAAAFHGLSFVLIDNAKNARPDVMCMALGWLAFAVYATLREKSLALALCAGNALVAVSGLTHPNGILYFAGLWLMVLWLDRSRLRWNHFALAALVYIAGAGLWSIYILQDPTAFVDQLRANSDHRFGVVSWSTIHLPLPLRLLWGEIHDRYLVVFGILSPTPASRLKGLVLLTYIAALIAVPATPLRRRRSVRLLMVMLALFFVIQATVNQKLGFYFVHIEPLYAALVGIAAAAMWPSLNRTWRLAFVAWFLLITGIQVGFTIEKARSLSTAASQYEIAQFLDSHARQARLIFGSACLIHSVGYDPRYLDDRYLGVRSGKHADVIIMADYLQSDLYDTLRQERPEDWNRISQRLGEYRLVLTRPGYHVYFTPELANALPK
ncbi:MAG TPA: hypothetical protein VHY84_20925 [Bryobacteraceae bacterium]|jgi:hypothetical protein|nr:hypothetical protein [Bryobacteraceae bacterium]